MSKLELNLKFLKSTRNTHVFADGAPVPTLYVKQEALPQGKAPESIKVTVEVCDE